MSKPMFLYMGIYDDFIAANDDYEAIQALHATRAIGSYDCAIISRHEDGGVEVTKSELPSHRGAWIGLAAGAGAAVIFPVLLPGVIAAGGGGAGLGAWFAHLAHGTSRREARELGELLEEGTEALIVIGMDRDAGTIEQAAGQAQQYVLKRSVSDWDAAEREANAAMEQAIAHATL